MPVSDNPNGSDDTLIFFLAVVPPDEMEATFRYGLKDITPDLDNFDQVIDCKNSSFTHPIRRPMKSRSICLSISKRNEDMVM